MDCKAAEELIPGYTLSILSRDERGDLEAHLKGCENCARLVREYRPVVGLMPLASEDASPSPTLKAKLIARIQDDLATARSRQHAAQPQRVPWWKRFFTLNSPAPYAMAAGVAGAAVIGLAIWNVNLHETANKRADELAQVRGSVHVVKATGTDVAPGATGQLVSLMDQGITTFRASGLVPLAADKTYQMWLLRVGVPVSAGLMQIDATRQGTAIVNGDVGKADGFAVTIEPAG
ncbi:MAG: anti-sigma factor, partial [Chloroflexi bacterium]|nr:anti-sigma factor [Chloroflexota bacterium]